MIDTGKAFESLETDIMRLQSCVDTLQSTAKQTKDMAVYRGRLASRRNLHPVSRLLSSLSGEVVMNLPQTRTFCMSEGVSQLVSNCIGGAYVKLPSESLLRLSILKSQFQEIIIKKIGEIALLHLWLKVDEEEIGRLSGSVEIWVKCLEILSANEQNEKLKLMQQELNLKNDILAKLEENVRILTEKKTNLEREFDVFRNKSEAKFANLQKEFDIFRKTNEEEKCKNLEEIRNLREIKAKIEAKKSIFVQTDFFESQEIISMRENLKMLQFELQNEQKLRKNAENEIKSIQESEKIEKETLEMEIKSAKNRIEELNSENNRLKVEIDGLKLEIQNHEFLYEKLQTDFKSASTAHSTTLQLQLDHLTSSAKETEACLTSQISKITDQLSNLRTELDQKDLEIANLTEKNRDYASEILENRSTIDRLQLSLSKLVNMDEDTFEAVMKNEMEMMRNAYELKLKEARNALEKVKKEKIVEVRTLKEALAEKERVLEVTLSRIFPKLPL